MPWIELWRPARISVDAWIANADRLAAMVGHDRWGDTWLKSSGAGFFQSEALQILGMLREINDAPDLPETARQRLVEVVNQCNVLVGDLRIPLQVQYFAMQIAHARGLLDHAHAVSEAPRRSRVERAFEHLNRSVVVDSEFRDRWRQAFLAGEIECEKRGAVHLLLHGVFAFKANDSGGRTDLVLGGELQVTPAVQGSEALCLTEWKLVSDDKEAVSIARIARRQTQFYRKGVLTGVEIAHTRFIVLVSQHHLPEVPDVWEPDHEGTQVLYRHLNVVIDPLSPSRAAARFRGGSQG